MVVYENEGHRRSCMRNYHRYAWKIKEWRRDPHCRNPKCGKLTSMNLEDRWQDRATCDHHLARGLGGSDTEENFNLLCGNCNNQKSKVEALLLKEQQEKKALDISG